MKIHFIGISGIGVSALAQYYLSKKEQVSGSDLVSSEIAEILKKKGAKVSIGSNKAKNIPLDADLVIYSPAVKKDNPEFKQAKKLKIRLLSYPEALGELTKEHFTIAVAGTHGKSTTTSMLALVLIKAGLDPTVIVGTKLKEFGNSNFRLGRSKYLLIEACEHEASFLNYYPQIIVLTNIEADHLDYYKNMRNVLKAFKTFVSQMPEKGILIGNKDDANILSMAKNFKAYSLKQEEAKKIKKVLPVPGEHNIYNALAALTTARALKIPDKDTLSSLSKYKGCWRRFEIFETKDYTLVSDYAHHPTEIKATLAAAREKFPKKKICCVFQPHQYQRTFLLAKDFIKNFSEALNKNQVNELILIDVYDVAGREGGIFKKKISSEKIVKEIKKKNKSTNSVLYVPTIEKVEKHLVNKEVIIVMGAGDIYNLSRHLST